MARRNPYRPGTPSYERQRLADLNRRQALAQGRAARAKTPATRRKALQQASRGRAAIKKIETLQQVRSQLSERDQAALSKLTIAKQQSVADLRSRYPDRVPGDVPDPFAERADRNQLWRLYYATRASQRGPRHIDDLPVDHYARRRRA